ncbi:hypothetical protein BDF22DRAFT_687470 [Syncephalis plumigaleata]|nr:hypothetical protein BDF22DRAFT_687470 [Syncephalis plumigaleata]
MAQVRTLDTILEEVECLLVKAANLWELKETNVSLAVAPFLSDIAQCSEESIRRRHLYANGMHPMGPINIDTLSLALKRYLAEARDLLMSYRDTTLPRAIAEGQTGCVSLRTFSSLLKEEATLHADVRRLREMTQYCQKQIVNACQDDTSRRKRLISQLESIAKRHGLESYCDETTQGQLHTTVMLAGAVVVIDVELKQSLNTIEAKVTYALPEDSTNSNTENLLLDQLLTRTLKSEDMASFEEQVAWLAAIDRYTKLNSSVDFFHCMQILQHDIATIFQREMSICSGDISTVLLYGHGVPLSDRVHPGPVVAYWAPRTLLVGTDWERFNQCLTISEGVDDLDIDSLKAFHYLHLQLEQSSSIHKYLSKEQSTYLAPSNDGDTLTNLDATLGETGESQYVSEDTAALLNSPLRFIQPNTPASIQCTAWLSPGVVVTLSMAQEIAQSVGLELDPNNNNNNNNNMSIDNVDHSLSFYEALVRESAGITTSDNKEMPLYFTEAMAFRKKLPTSNLTHEYAMVSSPPTVGIWLQRIPITHPYQLAKVERLIRQQLVFNALFKSCFSAEMAHLLDPNTRLPISMKEGDMEHSLWTGGK